MDSGVSNSVALVVMDESKTSVPSANFEYALLSPLKTIVKERLPNSSVIVELL